MTLSGPMTDLKGRLVVAAPDLGDPNFEHTVVLILDHGGDGALGVVLNRPSEVEVDAVLPAWEPVVCDPHVVFVGGPVQQNAVIGLALASGDADAVQPLLSSVGMVDLESDPAGLADVSSLRLFAGYSGWSPGQLEDEIEQGGWYVLDAGVDDIFTGAPDDLWLQVLRRQGGIFRTVPEDPSQN